MSHPDDGQLHALVDGELSPVAAAELQAHLAKCPPCRQRLDEARELLGETDRIVATLVVPPRAAGPTGVRHARFDHRLLGLAASALLVVTTGWLVLRPRLAPDPALPTGDVVAARAPVAAQPESTPTPAERRGAPLRKDAPTSAASNEKAQGVTAAADASREEKKTDMAKEAEQPATGRDQATPQALRADTSPAPRPADGVALNDLPPWKAKVAAPAAVPADARFRIDGLDVVSSSALAGGGTRLVYSVNGTPVEFDQVPTANAHRAPASGDVHELSWPRDDLQLTLRSTLPVGELERLRQLVR